MKKYYSLPGILIAIAFLAVSYFFISKSVDESKQFKEEKNKVADILNFNDRLLSFRDWVFTKEAWAEKKAEFEKTINQADLHYKKAEEQGYFLLYTCLAFFLLIVAIYARKRIFFGLTFASTFVALALLGQGVTNPILEMSAFKEELTIKVYVHADEIPYFEEAVEYIGEVNAFLGTVEGGIELVRIVPLVGESAADGLQGMIGDARTYVSEGEAYLVEHKDSEIGFDKVFPGRTYFYYQNKGIIDVISLLWKNNKPVAIAIGTFSVIVPGIKLLFTLFMIIFSVKGGKRLRKVLSYIAKWSMADVFVVSAFLAYLSFSNMSPGVQMDAKVLFGLYYFLGYVILSIVLGYLLDLSIKENIRRAEKVIQPEPEIIHEVIENTYMEKGDDTTLNENKST